MADIPKAVRIRPAGTWAGAVDEVLLDYDQRFLRRRRLDSAAGEAFMVDLPETTSLNHGDAFELEDGRLICVAAADEPLLEIHADDLVRLAWHIGNRHTPCQIEPGRLLIRRDHVLQDMVERLGGHVHTIIAPFRPEGGAYGHGRTLGHSHGADDHIQDRPDSSGTQVRFHGSHGPEEEEDPPPRDPE